MPRKFALYGTANVDPNNLDRARIPARSGAVVLTARVHEEIICAPCLLGLPEGEYIIDPRDVPFVSLRQSHRAARTRSDADGVALRGAASVKPGTHIALEFSDGTVGATADGEAAPAVAKPKQPSARSRSGEAAQGKLF